ncbi:MAG: hypothetical protein ACO1OQ_11500, partial [Rufibacter sp.]
EIFGLGEEDELKLSGQGPAKIHLVWHGGEDTDKITLDKSWKPSGKKLLVMEEEDGNEYPRHSKLKRKDYTPKATEFTAKGWLLRHRL